MQHPVFLENNHIVDSIVKFNYKSNFNIKYLNSIIVKQLNERFQSDTFYSIPFESDSCKEKIDYYTNNKFSFKLLQNDIVINCVNDYSGWNDYMNFINLLMNILCHEDKSLTISRVSIRYISLFEDVSIFDKINGRLVLYSFPRIEGMELHFKFNIAGKANQNIYQSLATVRTRNWMPNTQGNRHASVVDIALDSSIVPLMSLKTALCNLEHIHEQEKNIFFSLISDDFIKELKPHYAL